jgi:RNA polymerase sigma-54 factor
LSLLWPETTTPEQFKNKRERNNYMRPSLQLRFSQQLTMTPQLQQAIRLLQLSTLDLQQEIQDALDSNPLLEVEEILPEKAEQSIEDKLHSASAEEAAVANAQETDAANADTDLSDTKETQSNEALEKDTISEELPTDSEWDDYISAGPNSPAVAAPEENQVYQGETTENIRDYLTWQMNLTPFSETDLAIATAIIEAIDDKGFLTVSIEEILVSLGNDDVELDEIVAVLKRVQFFEPVGVAARDLKECLYLQLCRYDENIPWLAEAKIVVSEHILLLGARDYRTLMRKTKLKEDQLTQVMRLIHTLNPTPSSSVIQEENNYVIPDVTVVKKKGRWVVELNGDTMPKLRVNQQYAALSKTMKQSTDNQFIKSHLQEAKWFIKSLESRNDTLLKVSSCIVHQQQGFFEYGDEAMKPMVLNDVAEIVDMHESTISRVTTQKFMHTPRGIFELKYFFSSHVSTENGGECSSTAIRALIKKLVGAENQLKPLSDSKIADILAEQGIKVARRTIAKYRESLSIPPSNQRKSLL